MSPSDMPGTDEMTFTVRDGALSSFRNASQ